MKFRAALIGLGRMGAVPSARLAGRVPDGWLPLTHAEVIKSFPEFELIALCDSDESKQAEFARYYGVEHVYGDHRMLLTNAKPDLLSIATRTNGRGEIILDALNAGVNAIYAEKPLANSLGDSTRILERVASCGAVLGYGTTRRGMPIYRSAKTLVDSGELGHLVQVIVEFGKSNLLWTLPHAADLMVFYAGTTAITGISGHCEFEPSAYSARTKIIDADPLVSTGYIEFANGVTGLFSQGRGFTVNLVCERGNVVVHGDGALLEIRRAGPRVDYFDQITHETVPGSPSGTQFVFQQLLRVLQGKPADSLIHPEEIKAGQAILFGLISSALAGGKRLGSNEIDPELTVTGRIGDRYA